MAKCYEQRGSMADIKKIEIIERITDFNGAVIENTLTSWDHFYVKESVEVNAMEYIDPADIPGKEESEKNRRIFT